MEEGMGDRSAMHGEANLREGRFVGRDLHGVRSYNAAVPIFQFAHLDCCRIVEARVNNREHEPSARLQQHAVPISLVAIPRSVGIRGMRAARG